MFGWLSGKPHCPVGKAERDWIQGEFCRLLAAFGNENPLGKSVVVPDQEYFPFLFREVNADSIKLAFGFVAKAMMIGEDEVELVVRNGRNPRGVIANGATVVGLYCRSGSFDDDGREFFKDTIVVYEHDCSSMPEIVSVLAHEIAHYRLYGERYANCDSEYCTDLMAAIYGFGCMLANRAYNVNRYFDFDEGRIKHEASGYMTQEMFGYALAIRAYLCGEDRPQWRRHLRGNVLDVFDRGTRYLAHSKCMDGAKRFFGVRNFEQSS